MSPLLYLLLIPLVAMAAILLKAPPKATAMVAALLNLGLGFFLWTGYQVNGPDFQYEQSIPWVTLPMQFGMPDIRLHVGVDGLNLPLVLLAVVITVAAVAVTPATVTRANEFFIYTLMISVGAIGAFISLDLFFFYIFHELALIPTFLLMGIWGHQNRQFLATELTLYLVLGSLVLLAGIIALIAVLPVQSRTFDLVELRETLRTFQLAPGSSTTIYGLLLVGFGILISLFPFHSWAPQGYATCPAAAAMLHSGVLKKFGLYGLIRVAMPLFPEGVQAWEPVLIVLLLGNVVYIGFVTIAQKELTTMLGFASVMHMGYIFLALVAWNTISVSGAVLFMVAHGLCSALLFALADQVRTRTAGEARMPELGGLAQRMPFVAAMFIFGSMALVAMPGLANFSGEVLIFFGAFQKYPWLAGIIVWGGVISAVFQLRAVRAVFFGPCEEKYAQVDDVKGWIEKFPYLLLGGALLLLGCYPDLLLKVVEPSVRRLLGG